MLTYNLHKHFKLRAVSAPAVFLMQNGFNQQTAYRITKNKFSALSAKHIEKLCLALNCTPNDLMEWEPDKNLENPEKQSLNKLRLVQIADLRNFASDIPFEKMGEFAAEIEAVKKKMRNEA